MDPETFPPASHFRAFQQHRFFRPSAMTPSNDAFSDALPPGMVRPEPITEYQLGLFQISLADALVQLRVSPDDLQRWHERGWVSFDAGWSGKLDQFCDPRIFEIQIVRDVVRSGLADAQIDGLLSQLPKPLAFAPHRLAFSFVYGWVHVQPPVEIPEASDVQNNLDEWIEQCDEEQLEDLRDKVAEALAACRKSDK